MLANEREISQGGYGEPGLIPQTETPREVEMACYDLLPKELRDTLKELPLEMSAKDIAAQYKFFGLYFMIDELKRLAHEFYSKIVGGMH